MALVRRVSSVTWIESSPRWEVVTCPVVEMKSPMSRCWRRFWAGSVRMSVRNISWMEAVRSWRSANMSLPWPRRAMRRPTTVTVCSIWLRAAEMSV